MKTDNAPSRRAEPAPRLLGVVGDVALVALLAGFALLFLAHNGFIGNSGVQPYPY